MGGGNVDCREKIIQQRKFFDSGITRNIEWRKQKLRALYKAIKNDNYEIAPPHQAAIPKDNGDMRIVYVNENVDRIFLSIVNNLFFEMFPEIGTQTKYPMWDNFYFDEEEKAEYKFCPYCGNKL